MNEIWKKFGIVFSKGPSTMFGLELILLSLLFTSRSSDALSFIPEFLWYKTCADSPPGFSPGCMNNVTVNVGDAPNQLAIQSIPAMDTISSATPGHQGSRVCNGDMRQVRRSLFKMNL